MFIRTIQPRIVRALTTDERKTIVLYGPRQVGKTTLLESVRDELPGRSETLNGDFVDDQLLLRPERGSLSRLTSGLDYLFIDEAQNVDAIGRVLKLLHDHHPHVRVLATGSSSFELARRSGEPLTGRQKVFTLYPISYTELDPRPRDESALVEAALLYGGYPEVLGIESNVEKVAHLRQLVADYLLKDVLALADADRGRLLALLHLLALQLGSEVSLSELARSANMDAKTARRYLDVLEQAFVIVQLPGFSRNLRKEIAKARKIYFFDLGLRNAIIQAFQPLDTRTDLGGMWENYLIIERIKRNAANGIDARYHFWRTYDQQEVDLVEESADGLKAFEFKLSNRKARVPRLWRETYPDSTVEIVSRDTLRDFLAAPTAAD